MNEIQKIGLSDLRLTGVRGVRGVWLCALVASLIWVTSALGEENPSLEYQVKAAFLIKFGSFVEWPPANQSAGVGGTFVIGILGDDPFGKSFDEAAKKEKINGRAISVRRSSSIKDMEGCNLVFIPAAEMGRSAGAVSKLSEMGILTVGESIGFVNDGGIIGFYKDSGKVRFEINVMVAEKSGFKLSSKLLQVAKVVAQSKSNHG